MTPSMRCWTSPSSKAPDRLPRHASTSLLATAASPPYTTRCTYPNFSVVKLGGKIRQEVPMDAYCVVCKEKTLMMDGYRIKVSDSGRRMAQGKCSRCKVTKVNRILGKQESYYAQSPNHPVFYGKGVTTSEPTITKRIKITPDRSTRRSFWWEIQEYRDGDWKRVICKYAYSERDMKKSIKKWSKRQKRTEQYLDLNFNRI